MVQMVHWVHKQGLTDWTEELIEFARAVAHVPRMHLVVAMTSGDALARPDNSLRLARTGISYGSGLTKAFLIVVTVD
jgi:hypothetical protein